MVAKQKDSLSPNTDSDTGEIAEIFGENMETSITCLRHHPSTIIIIIHNNSPSSSYFYNIFPTNY